MKPKTYYKGFANYDHSTQTWRAAVMEWTPKLVYNRKRRAYELSPPCVELRGIVNSGDYADKLGLLYEIDDCLLANDWTLDREAATSFAEHMYELYATTDGLKVIG